MRIAVLIIGLILMIVVGFQSCLVATGEVILEGMGQEEITGGGGAIGMFAALLLGIAAAFALRKPFVSFVIFILAALFAFMAGSTGFPDMHVWGVFALILATLSILCLPDFKSKIKSAVKKWWFWLIVGVVLLLFASTCINGKEENAEKKEQPVVTAKSEKTFTDQFVIQVGSKNIQVNDMELTLDTPVREIDWHSYMPLRFFLDWFGAEDVTYDRATEEITFKLNRHTEIDPAIIEKYQGQKKATKPDEPTRTEPEKPAENSRRNPAGLNETFVVRLDDWLVGKVTYEIEMLELIRGDQAWDIIRQANQFNDEPEAGKEYILAKFRIAILETEEDEPYTISHSIFDVVSGAGVEYTDFISVAGLDPNLRADLYEGAEHIGWTYFLVNINDHPVAVMNRRRASEIWFDLRAK